MPIQKCTKDGKSGFKFGDSGTCYTGPDAKEKARRQGAAIEISKKQRGESTNVDFGELISQLPFDEQIIYAIEYERIYNKNTI